MNNELSIKLNSSAIFCLAIPANLLASSSLLHTKKTEPFSSSSHSFKSSDIPFSEKNFAIGPLPIIFPLFFSKVIYANPLAPSEIAQLFKLSKKLLG